MHVIATAGHVDHGKSTLVRALTGTDPDRLEEEHARGLSIELGYCWTSLPPAGDVAFVDVPGHERFITTMLSGVGPVPAVLLAVAADDPWMPQAAEHLAALDALGVGHGVVAVTRADLADPGPMVDRARVELSRTTLADSPVVAVSAATGAGLEQLSEHLVKMLAAVPEPDPTADVRLWVDRCFHVRGAGTVVTGTLAAGTVSVGDTLAVGDRPLRVRGVQSLGRPVPSVSGVARVALNVAGEDRDALDRHSVLTTPGAFRFTDVLDVRIAEGEPPPRRPVLHVGAAAVPVHVRPLSDGLARLTSERALPMRVGDRVLLRDPGSRRVWGAAVLDPAPPPLRRRGAARQRASDLEALDGSPDLAEELRRRGRVQVRLLEQLGVPVTDRERASATSDGWLVDEGEADRLRVRLARLVEAHEKENPLEPALSVPVLADRLGLESPRLVEAVVRPPLRVAGGRVTARAQQAAPSLPAELERAIATLDAELESNPFAAPTAGRLKEVGLHPRGVVAASKAGRLLHLGDGVVLRTGADHLAVERLRELPQPFTTSEARTALGTSRRVVLPLLQHLDRQGRTRRLPDDRRSVVQP